MNCIEEILTRIKNSEDLQQVLKEYNWRSFEEFVAWVFQQFDYKTKIHYRFKLDKTYEIDVLAEKTGKCFLVECKKWRGKTASPSRLEKAAKYHKEKVKAFNRTQKKNCIGIIVTLLDLPLEIEGIKLVPVSKLNYFLIDFG